MLAHVSNSLSQKFPLALLLVFQIFLITEIGRVVSSPATTSTDGVIKVRGSDDCSGFIGGGRRAGNFSRADGESCLENNSECDFCDNGHYKCCGFCSKSASTGKVLCDNGQCIPKGRSGCNSPDKRCCANNDEETYCFSNYCTRKCIKVGSKIECERGDDCCSDIYGRPVQCISEDGTSTPGFCTTCTPPDSDCNLDKDDCCYVNGHRYTCMESGDQPKCRIIETEE